MDDEPDMIATMALAAAVIVNAGNGAPPEGVIAQAQAYEAHLRSTVTGAPSA